MVLGRFSIRKVDNFAIELPLSFGYMDVIQRHFNVGLIFSLAVNNADCIQFLKSGDDSAFPKSPRYLRWMRGLPLTRWSPFRFHRAVLPMNGHAVPTGRCGPTGFLVSAEVFVVA